MASDRSAKQISGLGPGRHRVASNLYLAIGANSR